MVLNRANKFRMFTREGGRSVLRSNHGRFNVVYSGYFTGFSQKRRWANPRPFLRSSVPRITVKAQIVSLFSGSIFLSLRFMTKVYDERVTTVLNLLDVNKVIESLIFFYRY